MSEEEEEKQKFLKGFKPTTNWFHIFKSVIDSGQAGEMGPTCFLVYAVVKSHIHLESGTAFPKLETIAYKSNLTKKTVQKCLKKLQDMGFVTRTDIPGRSPRFKLQEKLQVTVPNDAGDDEMMLATFDYVPMGVRKAVQDIKNLQVTGELPENSVVNIKNMTVNVMIAPKAHTAINQINFDDLKDKELRDLVRESFARRGLDPDQDPED